MESDDNLQDHLPSQGADQGPTFTGSNIPGNAVTASFVSIILGENSVAGTNSNNDLIAGSGGYWYYPPGSPPAKPQPGDAPNTVYVTAFPGVFIPFSSASLNGNMQLTLSGGLRNSPSAIETVLSLRPNQHFNRNQATRSNPYFTHYRGSGWDPNFDNDSSMAQGKYNPYLNQWSLAIRQDFGKANGLTPLGPVYVNGIYIGNWDDRVPFGNTIDVYDYSNLPSNVNWGGIIDNATISPNP